MLHELNYFLPIQVNFALEAKHYQFFTLNKATHSILFYQYQTNRNQHSLAVIPDGCLDIQFCCDADNPQISLCGSTLTNENKTHKPDQLYMGVRFPPSISRRIGWIPYGSLTNTKVSSDSINIASQSMLDQLCMATSFSARVQLVDQWLTRLGIPGPSTMDVIDECMQQIHNHSGNIKLTTLARHTGLSERRLRQKFMNELGISPKLYCRIQRFQLTLQHLLHNHKAPAKVHDLANAFHYYDESHLIKEFQAFSQNSPLTLHALLREKDSAQLIQ